MREPGRRINLLTGSVRSGKTFVSLVKWALTAAASPAGAEFLMAGVTLRTLERNCLRPLAAVAGDGWRYSLSAGRGELFGRAVWLEGAADSRAEARVRGLTLYGAYLDELTLIPREFYRMLLSRLSVPGASLWATTNPDHPRHWVMTEVIANDKVDRAVHEFRLSDNSFLGGEYVRQLKREYTGVFYQRYILGRWTAAEGAVYDMFDPAVHVTAEAERAYARYYVSCDYGTQNPCVFLLWGLCEGVWVLIREYYYDGRAAGRQKTDQDYAEDYEEFIGGIRPRAVIADPSAASFLVCLRGRGVPVVPAANGVLDGIRTVAGLLAERKIVISGGCRQTIREFQSYRWDPRAAEAGEDKPLKQNDHAMDAVRYFAYTALRTAEKGRTVARERFGGRI